MTNNRKVEIFSAGCRACEKVVAMVNDLVCDSCEVTVLDMNQSKVFEKAKILGIQSVPAVAIDGQLAKYCRQKINKETLKAAGLGQA